MSEKMNVFVSYSHQDQRQARTLIEGLEASGISTVSAAGDFMQGQEWERGIGQAIRSADAVVLLVDSKHEPDPLQQSEWRAAVEAGWEEPNKRLIPLLLGDTEVPSFLSNRMVIRVRHPRQELKRAVEQLAHVLKNERTPTDEFLSTEVEDPAKRQERLRYIEEIAQSLKSR
jgi:hypothetical protein